MGVIPGRLAAAACVWVGVGMVPARAAEHLRFLPSDTRQVITINLAALPAGQKGAFDKLGERLYRAHLAPGGKDDDKLAIREVTSLTIASRRVGWPGGTIIV